MSLRARLRALGLAAVMILAAAQNGAAQEPARRGWLGFTYTATGAEQSVRVADTYRGSPAARAGLRRGDEIVEWNGRPEVRSELQALTLEPGDTVRLQVRGSRGGERRLVVVAANRPPALSLTIPRAEMEEFQREMEVTQREIADRLRRIAEENRPALDSLRTSLRPRLRDIETHLRESAPQIANGMLIGLGVRTIAGAEFMPMNEDLGASLGADEGLLVLQVSPGTPSDRSGLRSGDVVLSADGEKLATVGRLRDIVIDSSDRMVALEILRRRERQSLQLKWE